MPFLIPTARPNPSGIARLGRLLFWCAVALAVLLVAMAIAAFTTPIPASVPSGLYVPHGLPWDTYLSVAVLVLISGRGLCYLLAGE